MSNNTIAKIILVLFIIAGIIKTVYFKEENEVTDLPKKIIVQDVKPVITPSDIIGKWILVSTENKETGRVTYESPNTLLSNEYYKIGISISNRTDDKLTEFYSIAEDFITYNPGNPLKERTSQILELNDSILKISESYSDNSWLISTYKRATP